MPLDLLASAEAGGIGAAFPCAELTHVAAAIGFLQRLQVLGFVRRWWDEPRSRDEVGLGWMAIQASERCTLGPERLPRLCHSPRRHIPCSAQVVESTNAGGHPSVTTDSRSSGGQSRAPACL